MYEKRAWEGKRKIKKYERKDDIEERDEEKYCCHSPMYEQINEEIMRR